MRFRLSSAALVLTALAAGHAGNEDLKDWARDKKLEKQMVILPHATSNAVKKLRESGFEKPRKVGLISFYNFDAGEIKFNTMNKLYGSTSSYMPPPEYTTTRLTPKGANHFATRLAELGIPALRKTLADHGMELLLPVEFVKTDEQAAAYANFELPVGKLGGATLAMAQYIQKTPKVSSAADGFSGIHTHLWTDAKGLTALEELRKVLGLDAMVVLANTSNSDAKGLRLTGIQFFLYGPNPIPMPPQKIAQIAWSPGALYAQGQFGKSFQGAPIAEMKKGEVKSETYEGYDVIVATLADAALDMFEKQYGE